MPNVCCGFLHKENQQFDQIDVVSPDMSIQGFSPTCWGRWWYCRRNVTFTRRTSPRESAISDVHSPARIPRTTLPLPILYSLQRLLALVRESSDGFCDLRTYFQLKPILRDFAKCYECAPKLPLVFVDILYVFAKLNFENLFSLLKYFPNKQQ